MRLFVPQFKEFRNATSIDRPLHVEDIDIALQRIASVINGGLDITNFSKSTKFTTSQFLEPYSLVTFAGQHTCDIYGGSYAFTPTGIYMGTVPVELNGAVMIPVHASATLCYAAPAASDPVVQILVGATSALTSGVSRRILPGVRQSSPFGLNIVTYSNPVGENALVQYLGQSTITRYTMAQSGFNAGVTGATGAVVRAVVSPAYPELESEFSITFKVLHIT